MINDIVKLSEQNIKQPINRMINKEKEIIDELMKTMIERFNELNMNDEELIKGKIIDTVDKRNNQNQSINDDFQSTTLTSKQINELSLRLERNGR